MICDRLAARKRSSTDSPLLVLDAAKNSGDGGFAQAVWQNDKRRHELSVPTRVHSGHNAQRCQSAIGDTRNIGMVFDEWLRETILLTEFLGKLRGKNSAPRHIAIDFAVLDPLCAACTAFEAEGFSPKYGRIGHERRFGIDLLAAIKHSER